jgi:hypothetical protein
MEDNLMRKKAKVGRVWEGLDEGNSLGEDILEETVAPLWEEEIHEEEEEGIP